MGRARRVCALKLATGWTFAGSDIRRCWARESMAAAWDWSPRKQGDVHSMNTATAADEVTSETRLRAAPRATETELEREALEAIAQLEVLAELLECRLEAGDDTAGAPAFALRATIRKLRRALP